MYIETKKSSTGGESFFIFRFKDETDFNNFILMINNDCNILKEDKNENILREINILTDIMKKRLSNEFANNAYSLSFTMSNVEMANYAWLNALLKANTYTHLIKQSKKDNEKITEITKEYQDMLDENIKIIKDYINLSKSMIMLKDILCDLLEILPEDDNEHNKKMNEFVNNISDIFTDDI